MSNILFFGCLPSPQKSKLSHLLLGEHDIPLTCLEQVVTGTSGAIICNKPYLFIYFLLEKVFCRFAIVMTDINPLT